MLTDSSALVVLSWGVDILLSSYITLGFVACKGERFRWGFLRIRGLDFCVGDCCIVLYFTYRTVRTCDNLVELSDM